jgi:hypothetical protein
MDVVVGLVLGGVGLICAGVVFYARRNDLVHLIRSPADALLFVFRNSPPKPQSESGDQPDQQRQQTKKDR